MVNKFIRASMLALFLLLTTYTVNMPVQQAYATATPLPPPFSKFFYPSSSQFAGQPLAGGQVLTYAAGTTTPLASYTDSTALVQNSNPVILNSNGEANIWIAGAYKIVVEDAAGNVLSTTDNVQDLFTYDFIQSTSTTSLAVQNGSSLTLTTQAGKYYSPGLFVMIVDTAAPTTNWMHCPITSYIGTQLICTPDASLGSGTYATWTISLSGPIGPTGPTGPTGSGAGDMTGATNLAQGMGGVANTATARANLGLGSAAILNIGTGASQVVQLNGSAQLPAVDGSQLINLPNQITLGTPTSFNSGTSYPVTGLPAGIHRIIMNLDQVTVSVNADLLFQIGTSGGNVTSGYAATCTTVFNSAGTRTYTAGVGAINSNGTPVWTGTITFNLIDASNNIWVASFVLGSSNAGSNFGGGTVTLSGPLSQITFTTVGGSATWTGGKINIAYE